MASNLDDGKKKNSGHKDQQFLFSFFAIWETIAFVFVEWSNLVVGVLVWNRLKKVTFRTGLEGGLAAE